MDAPALTAVLAGLTAGLSLIIAIGAQNAFVLRQGVTGQHVGVVVAICTISDIVLITAGIAGVGALVEQHPTVLRVLTWAGAAYLIWFGAKSILSSRNPQALTLSAAQPRGSIALTAITLTWLNPHVYLDTVLMLGNLAVSYGPHSRWWFGLGASVGSIVWFLTLGYAARLASRWFARPRTWQILDVVIGLVMFALAAMLLLRSP